MKILLISLGTLAGLLIFAGLVLYLIGRAQPERHTASITFTLTKSRAIVWAALTDYAAMPRWWPAVKAIRFETRTNGEVITWNSDPHGKEIGFRTKEEKLRRISCAKSWVTTCLSAAPGLMNSRRRTVPRRSG
jgi:hypothetical protein